MLIVHLPRGDMGQSYIIQIRDLSVLKYLDHAVGMICTSSVHHLSDVLTVWISPLYGVKVWVCPLYCVKRLRSTRYICW